MKTRLLKLLKYRTLTVLATIILAVIIASTVFSQPEKPSKLGGPGGSGEPSRGPGGQPPGVSAPYTLSGVYTVGGGSAITETDANYTSDKDDVSAIYVTDESELNLIHPTIVTSGNTSSQENSSFYGLNAAVLATKGSTITIEGGTIVTSGEGANGVIATDADSAVTLSNTTITATNHGGHGVMATYGGSITLINVDMDTSGRSSAPIATDRGSGAVNVTGGTVISSGEGSPGIYATGIITATDLTAMAAGAEAVVIEGKNTVTVTNSKLRGDKRCGVMIYQSFSGDAEVGVADYSMTGGSLIAGEGPLFYVTNTTADVTLSAVNANAFSGKLLQVGKGRWGRTGENGGTLNFTTKTQSLSGDIVVDELSSVTLSLLENSALAAAIDPTNTAKEVNLVLDESSTWTVTEDSNLTCLTEIGGISGKLIRNIIGNGHTIFYDQNVCQDLGGLTYALNGGGTLRPAGTGALARTSGNQR